MRIVLYLFALLSITINAQQINLKILDYSNNLSIDDADIYFAQSTKNFVSDLEGKVVVDLSNINSKDELIVSKKDYQDAKIKVANLSPELTIKLEKISEVELKEAFVSNLKAEDILRKAYDNYDKNFTTEEHYHVVNFKQDATIDLTNRDLINVDLQFRFKKDNLKVKSNEVVKERIIGDGTILKPLFRINQFFNDISLLDRIKKMQNSLQNNEYITAVKLSSYADKLMYEITLERNTVVNYFLIDKDSFAIVEHTYSQSKTKSEDYTINFSNVSYKYRPYQNKWILKESSKNWNSSYKEQDRSNHIIDVKINLEVKDFSSQPFPKFNKSINEKMDIRRSFD